MKTIEDYGCKRGTCPSELEMEQRLLDELGPLERAALDRSVAACEGCRARFDALSAGFAAFPDLDADALQGRILAGLGETALPPAIAAAADALGANPAAAAVSTASLWDRLRGLFRQPGFQVSLGVAAAAVIFLIVKPDVSPDTPGVRMKGTLSMVVHRERDGVAAQIMSGEHVREGDRLRFEVTAAEPGHLMVLGREASGATYLVYPLAGGGRSVPQPAGRKALPGSVALDASQGRERLFTVWCPEAFERDAVKLSDRGAAAIDGCSVAIFEMNKAR